MTPDDPHLAIDTEVNQDGRYPDAFDDALCATGFGCGYVGMATANNSPDENHDVTASIWSTPDNPSYQLGTVTMSVGDDYVKLLVPRARLDQYSACPRYPNGYTVFATDGDGNPVYDGTVSYTMTRATASGPGVLMKCEPAELLD